MKKLVFCIQQKLPVYCSWLLCCCNMFTFVWTSGKQTRKLHYQQCWLLKQPHYQQQAPASKQGNYDGRKMNYNWKEGKTWPDIQVKFFKKDYFPIVLLLSLSSKFSIAFCSLVTSPVFQLVSLSQWDWRYPEQYQSA